MTSDLYRNSNTIITDSLLRTSVPGLSTNTVLRSPERYTSEARIVSPTAGTYGVETRLSHGNLSPSSRTPNQIIRDIVLTHSPTHNQGVSHTIIPGSYNANSYAYTTTRSPERTIQFEGAKRSTFPGANSTVVTGTTVVPGLTPGFSPQQALLLGYKNIGPLLVERNDGRYLKAQGDEPNPQLDLDDPELIRWIENEHNHLKGKNTPYDIHELLNHADYRVRESRSNQVKIAGGQSDLTLRSTVMSSPEREHAVAVNNQQEETRKSSSPNRAATQAQINRYDEWQKKSYKAPAQDNSDDEDMSNFCGMCVSSRSNAAKKQK
jgi:hypothetical protein